MLVLDGTESRYGAEEHPSRSLYKNRATPEGTGDSEVTYMERNFYVGDTFGGWTMAASAKKGAPVMRLWPTAGASPHTFDGHVTVLNGTLSQTFATEVGETYRLAYGSYGVQFEPESSGCGVGDVLINGAVVQTVVTSPGQDVGSHETYFIAESAETVLSFASVGRTPFGLGNLATIKVVKVVFCERDMLAAMFGI